MAGDQQAGQEHQQVVQRGQAADGRVARAQMLQKSGRMVVLENSAPPSGQPTASIRQAAKLNFLSARDMARSVIDVMVTGFPARAGTRKTSWPDPDAGQNDDNFLPIPRSLSCLRTSSGSCGKPRFLMMTRPTSCAVSASCSRFLP